MSKLADFRNLERAIFVQVEIVDALKKDPRLRQELEFEEKLRALLGKYDKSLIDIISIFALHEGEPETPSDNDLRHISSRGRVRLVKMYRNPYNGKVVEAKSLNHGSLKLWKKQHGASAVRSWVYS